jgi:membrane-associated phospholipid phosphatase
MLLDAVITGAVVAAAAGWILWRLLPRRRPAPAACAACAGHNRK